MNLETVRDVIVDLLTDLPRVSHVTFENFGDPDSHGKIGIKYVRIDWWHHSGPNRGTAPFTMPSMILGDLGVMLEYGDKDVFRYEDPDFLDQLTEALTK